MNLKIHLKFRKIQLDLKKVKMRWLCFRHQLLRRKQATGREDILSA